MKNKLILLSFLITFKINSQISQKLLENGIKKCNQKNRIEALDDFNKLLNLNNSNKDAYFNRGKCEFEFKNFISAISDFNKTIKLDSNYVKAYYYRAKALINIGENELALLDIDKTIKLEPLNPKYFLNRGKIKIDIGYIEEAYEDFNFAKQLGDNKADIYLSQFCINDNENNEFFFLDWLQEGSWKIVDKIEKDKIKVLELIPLNETLKNWTKFGNMMLLKNTYSSSLEYSMNKIFESAKLSSPNAKLNFIEKNENTQYPWIIFEIELPKSNKSKEVEVGLWHFIQGKNNQFANALTIKKSTFTDDIKTKWIIFFKTGKVLNNY